MPPPLDRESEFFLNENESEMAISAEFDGTAQIGLKMPTNTSTFKATPIFESREDYAGSFRIIERVDEYEVPPPPLNKSAEGSGIVVVDKRIGDAQRSYESGTGSYSSEEPGQDLPTNYIAKDIRPQILADGPEAHRWRVGQRLRKVERGDQLCDPGTSLIAEEYSSITELDKETVARGLNEMDTEANFSGRGEVQDDLLRSLAGRIG